MLGKNDILLLENILMSAFNTLLNGSIGDIRPI